MRHCSHDGEQLLPDEAFSNADSDLTPGTAVGEYQVEHKLGEGGFGSVYRAMHPLIGKIAAVKILHRSYSSDPQIVSRFIAEARAVNQIRHPNIIDIFSFGRLEDGRHFFVMELLDGFSFEALLSKRGSLTVGEALPILRGTARAIDAAHAAGIAHRDLKPDNVFLATDADGKLMPKLLDFGIAKLLGEETAGHKTRTGAPIGTPDYMSPQQCRGEPVDQRTDIYSFGVMTYRTLTGRLPFSGKSVIDVLYQHSQAAPPAPSTMKTDFAPELDAPLLAMLAKDPDARPRTVSEALEALVVAASSAGLITGAEASIPIAPMSHPGASIRVVTGGGGKSSPGSQSPSLVGAKTMLQPPPSGSSATFIGAETDVGTSKPASKSSRSVILGIVALVVGLGAFAGALLVAQGGGDKPPAAAASSATSEATTAASAITTAPTVQPGALASSAPAADLAPVASSAAVVESAAPVASSAKPAVKVLPKVTATARPTARPEYEDPFK